MNAFIEVNSKNNASLELVQRMKKIKYFAMSSGACHRLSLESEEEQSKKTKNQLKNAK